MKMTPSIADFKRLYFRVETQKGYEYFLKVPEPGVTFLLGKNGSGKSSLLNGLSVLAGHKVKGAKFSVSLITAAQSQLSQEVWNDHLSTLGDDGSMLEWLNTAPRLMECLNHHRFKESLSLPKTLKQSGFEFARLYGFEEREIPSYVSKNPGFVFEQTNPNAENFFFYLPRRLGVELSPAWVFLECVAQSTFSQLDATSNYSLSQASTEVESWIHSPQKRNLLSQSFRQFCTNVKLEFSCRDSSIFFRYINEFPDSGSIPELFRILDLEISELLSQQDDQLLREPLFGSTIYEFFPHNLFNRATLPNSPALATQWIRISDKWNIVEWTKTEGWLFDKLSITPVEEVDHSLSNAEDKFLRRYISSDGYEIEDDALLFRFKGLQEARTALEDISSDFQTIDIGISNLVLHLEKSDLYWGFEEGFELPVKTSIRWKDAISGELRPLLMASEGQKQILSAILSLNSQDRAINGLLLFDEFDRALHPSAAKSFAHLLHKTLRRIDGVAVLSTHNPSVTTASENVNWYATRDPLGVFTASTSFDDVSVLAQDLGVDELDAIRLKRLIVLGEGMHEELILGRLIDSHPEIDDHVWLMTANGINNYSLAWEISLRLFSMPVLVVYDKQDARLQLCLEKLQQLPKTSDAWVASGLAKLQRDLKRTRSESFKKKLRPPDGHHELGKMLDLIKEVIRHGGVERISVLGLDLPDIVDCLDPKHFKDVTSWSAAHHDAQKENLSGEEFKRKHRINLESISSALDNPDFTWHPELQKVYSRIAEIIQNHL